MNDTDPTLNALDPIYRVHYFDANGEEMVEDVPRTYPTACYRMQSLQDAGFVAWVV